MTSLYINSGGSRKTTSSAYANISGTRKQIFPLSTSLVYTWNKYNIVYTQAVITEELRASNGNWLVYDGDTFYTSDSLWEYGLYSPTAIYIPDHYNFSMSQFKKYWSMTDTSDDGYMGWIGFVARGGEYVNSVWASWAPGGYMGEIRNAYMITGYTPASYSKGSTNYGTVTSTNRYAYPDNNYSGSYWYVFVG